jgi:radical SAM superfamily enzyme YgiQ (UPF0313 family)
MLRRLTNTTTPRTLIRRRLAAETGQIPKQAPFRAALVYPSPYFVAMSSLGFQTAYRSIQATPEWCCERVFHPDAEAEGLESAERPISYEGERSLREFSLIAFSVSYELEISGLIRILEASGIPALRQERGEDFPLVLAGGPLTFSNPTTLLPYVDAVLLGECEQGLPELLVAMSECQTRRSTLERWANHPGILVPGQYPETTAELLRADDHSLPAFSPIRTAETELSNMVLIEAERGCSRGCHYCVMRRSTNGGMRIVEPRRILDRIPEDARKVGLVGAAVSDHPQIVDIVDALTHRGCKVGLSSLRPDKLKEPFVAALARAGYRTLTTALDGASERLRTEIDRRGRVAHYEQAAQLARTYGMDKLKLYLMIGLPGETQADIDECSALVGSLSRIIPVTLGISPFCAKRNTPLDGMPYAGISTVQQRIQRLRSGLAGRAEVRPTSSRWAWVEHVLSQGGVAEGRAVLEALRQGGRFANYREAFSALGHHPEKTGYENAAMPAPRRETGLRRLSIARVPS